MHSSTLSPVPDDVVLRLAVQRALDHRARRRRAAVRRSALLLTTAPPPVRR